MSAKISVPVITAGSYPGAETATWYSEYGRASPGLRLSAKPLLAEAEEIRKKMESEQEAVDRREEERAAQIYG